MHTELQAREREVQGLEQCLADSDGKRGEELERCGQVMQDLRNQMEVLQEQQKASSDMVKGRQSAISLSSASMWCYLYGRRPIPVFTPACVAQQVSCAEDELTDLRAERSRLVEQLSLRDQALQQLEESTSLLQQRYQEALDEVSSVRMTSL